MSDEQLLVTLGIQDKGANKQITALNKELKALDKEFKSASTTTKDFEKSQQGLTTKLSNLNQKYDVNKAKLDAYKQKLEETTKAIQDQQEKIANMQLEGKDTAKAEEQLQRMKNTLRDTERNISATQNEMERLNNEISETNKTIQNQSLEQYREEMRQLGESIEKTGNKMQNFGQGMQNTGSTLMKISAPLVAFSGYAVKASMDFEDAMRQVAATMGMSVDEINNGSESYAKLENAAKECGETTKFSASQAAEALNYIALAGYDANNAVELLPKMLNLAAAGGLDLQYTSDALTDSMSALGIGIDDVDVYIDQLAKTSQKSNTSVGQLLEAILTVGGTAKTCSGGITEMNTAIGIISDNGTKASEAGTALRNILLSLSTLSDDTREGLRGIGIETVDLKGNLLPLNEIMHDMLGVVGSMGSAEKSSFIYSIFNKTDLKAVQALMGSTVNDTKELGTVLEETGYDFEGLGHSMDELEGSFDTTIEKQEMTNRLMNLFGMNSEQAEIAYTGLNGILGEGQDRWSQLSGMIDDSAGAAQSMADVLNSSTKSQITLLLSQLEGLGIQIGEKLLPYVNDLLGAISDLITWFSSLDEGTQQAIVKFGLLTFATGGVLNATGKMTSNIGGLVSGIGKLTASAGTSATSVGALGSAAGTLSSIALPLIGTVGLLAGAVALYNEEQKALSSSVVTSKEELGLLKSTLLELNGVQVKSKEELEDLGLVYKDFSDGLSDDFKSAISEAGKDVENFTIVLQELSLDGVLSDEETTEFNTRVKDCVSNALSEIESKKTEGQTLMSEVFKLNDNVIDENEQAIIDMCNKQYEVEAEEVKKNQDLINQIYNTARSENRTLTQEEISSIKQYYANIKQIELECKAQNNSELEASTIDFNNRIKGLDAQSASELLQAKKAELDEQLIQKKNQYDQVILMAEKAAQDLTGAEKTAADERIQNLKDEKQKCTEEYQGQWQKYQEIIETEAPNISSTINKYSGEILTSQDLVTQQGLEKMKAHYDGLSVVTDEGWYKIKDTTTGAITDCYMTVDKNTGEITACYNKTTGEVAGYTDDMKKKVKELGDEHITERNVINQMMGQIGQSHVDTGNQIISKNGEVIGSLKDVTTSADGVKQGIVNINGTPMQITTNADGVITDMTTVKDKVDDIPKEKECKINFIQNGLDWIKSKWDSITSKSVSVDANANGTYSYSGSGVSTVDEKGWELASNNNVQVLGTYAKNTLTSIPTGTAIKTHMQSVQEMKYAVQEEVRKSKLNYANNNVSQGSSNIDYEKLANVMLNVVIQGLSNVNINNNINVDSNGIARNTIKMLGREDKINRVSKGRT
ncbi:phage tail tape measure protein [Clostridium butyricum]|uniref:Phage tail tape measure protein, family, core region n=1 Tax=Clostridium butyricum E4 str. BoNT E BL5262 TaxID=632245 RepID=C4IGZ3_CLOBU|nr:phage tail tape measure protein [Clostridium butyricum]EEP53245.1 phage tail tape measure protein, family, core region [Clostridium butyricum E4 str. BoNT E BL5262]NFL30556.1 phage tail tape measure protein [Clostridium butyricum]NFS19511.1 phage tail tape measure protein [Clostridium butyricum]